MFYYIKFKNGFETMLECAEGFDVGTEIAKWKDDGLSIDGVIECKQLEKKDFYDILSQPDKQKMLDRLKTKKAIKVNVKSEWLAIEQEKDRRRIEKEKQLAAETAEKEAAEKMIVDRIEVELAEIEANKKPNRRKEDRL